MTIDERIQDELQALGVSKRYCGYRPAALALSLAWENEDRLLNISRGIYQPVSELCGRKAYNVERNIRTIAHIAWERNPERLQAIARYSLAKAPTSLEFLSILLGHIQRTSQAEK